MIVDHLSDAKRWEVCIYFRNFLLLINIKCFQKLVNFYYLCECILFMIKIGHGMCNFDSSYSSLNQFYYEFENSWNNSRLVLDDVSATNPILLASTVALDAKSNNWNTGNITTLKDSKTETVFFYFGLQKCINSSTHIHEKSVSCVRLIFNIQPNLLMHLGFHSSFHPICHHQKPFHKFNLFPTSNPLTDVWRFEKINTDHMKKVINRFTWENYCPRLHTSN